MRILALVGGAVLSIICAFAQVTTSSISGRISDSEGIVVGAAVITTHVPSGTTYYATTDRNGAFRVNAITPGGPYTVKVEMLGYRTAEFTDVYAPIGEVVTLNVGLEVEALGLEAAVFTAGGADSGMNLNNAGVSTSVSQKTMSALPTVNRSLTDVMMLTPQSSSNSNGTSLGGGNYRSSFVSVDGAAFQNSFGIGSNLPAGGSPISLDALEQLSVDITPFDVRHSGFTGGAINAVTKSGTNQWHASVYNYYTNDQLAGDRIADEKLSLTESFSNVTGLTLGGPIIKNKLFFFLNAEYSPETNPSSKLARPSESDKFGGVYSRPTEAFMNEVSDYLKNTYGYDPGPYQNYSIATPDWKVMARVDWNINNSNKLNVRFNHTANMVNSWPSTSVSPMSHNKDNMYHRYDYGRTSDYAMFFQGSNYQTLQQFTSLSAELNSRFLDGTLNNMFRFTWSHQNEERSFMGDVFPTVDILQNTDDGKKAVITSFGLDPFTLGNLRDVQTITVTDEVSIMKGINNITAGLQFEWDETKNGYMQMGTGYYLYNSWEDFKNNAKPAAFGITHPNNANLNDVVYPSFQYMQLSVYAQDELNISDYFKLTAGLRFELPIYPTIENNHNAEFSTLAATSQSFKGFNTDDLPAARLSVSPRIGFNWDILKNRSLILRGGSGIYTGRIPFVWIVSAVGNSNCIQAQYYDQKGGTDIGFHTNVKDIVTDLYDLTGAYESKNLPAPQGATILDKNLKLPSTWKTSLALEGRLPGGIKATLEGIYNKDLTTVYVHKLGMVQDADGVQLPGEPAKRVKWTSEGIVNSTGQAVNPLYLTNSDVNGYYYSVTAQLQKDFNFGLSMMAAYTYSDSQSLSEGYGDQVSSAFSANNYNVNGSNIAALGHSGFVSPNRVIANLSYAIKQGNRGKSTFSLFYEGMNLCYIGSYSYNRMSYVMNNVTGDTGANNLIYIPTAKELEGMPFSSEENKAEFEKFIQTDSYLSKHRGEYSERGGVTVPWNHRFNFKFAQDINFNVAGRENTIQVGFDINNIGNLINSNWGVAKEVNSEQILTYKNDVYTFSAPEWTVSTNAYNTWQMLVSLRWMF